MKVETDLTLHYTRLWVFEFIKKKEDNYIICVFFYGSFIYKNKKVADEAFVW